MKQDRTTRILARFSMLVLVLVILTSSHSYAHKTRSDMEDWYIDTKDGVTLYVLEIGKGDTAVVIHGGWGAEHSYFLDAVQGLENQYHFIFYDQRGSLRSPCPDSLISVEKHIEDLEELRSELGIEKMNLIGHSTGGFLAMSYLRKYPDLVKGLILLSPVQPKYPITTEEEEAIATDGEPAIRAFLERPEIEATLKEEGLDREELTEKERSHAWKIRFAGANIYHVDRWRQLKGGGSFFSQKANNAAKNSMPESWNFIGDLATHDYPVSIILGDHDIVDSDGRLNRFWFENVDNVEVIVVEEAGHNAWIDQSTEFRRLLRTALRKYRRYGSARR